MNHHTTLQLYAAAVEALAIWESRLAIDRIQAEAVVPGKITISLIGKYLPSGEEITIEGVVIS
jgi:phage baseplate assembly protein W